jgi:hypothetical protein
MRIGIMALIGCVAGIGTGNPAAQTGSPATNTLTACEAQRGFSLLFDGTRESFASHFVEFLKNDSTTETPLRSTWKSDASDSAMHSGPSQPDLRSREKYADFDLRMEYRNDGAAGIFYRGLLTGANLWETAAEYTINDGVENNRKLAAGSVYDLFKPSPETYRPFATRKWNQARIVSVGDSVEHWMNGARIAAFRYHSEAWWYAVDQSKWAGFPGFCVTVPGNRKSEPVRNGYLGLQGNWGGRWAIRSLRVSRRALFYDEAEGCPETVAMRPAGSGPSVAPAAAATLRRTARGLSLDLEGLAAQSPRSALLLSLDGRLSLSVALAPGAREAVFPGAHASASGLYWVGIRTAAGVSWRKLSLL